MHSGTWRPRCDRCACPDAARQFTGSARRVPGVRTMTTMPTLWRRFRDDERGAGFIAAFIVLFGVLPLAGVGLIVDSARVVSAQRQASSAAYEAARAGANAVQLGTVRGGAADLDPGAARAAALSAASELLAGTDATVSNVAVSGGEVIVT